MQAHVVEEMPLLTLIHISERGLARLRRRSPERHHECKTTMRRVMMFIGESSLLPPPDTWWSRGTGGACAGGIPRAPVLDADKCRTRRCRSHYRAARKPMVLCTSRNGLLAPLTAKTPALSPRVKSPPRNRAPGPNRVLAPARHIESSVKIGKPSWSQPGQLVEMGTQS